MPDREKVLNGLRCHSECERGFNCDNCEYLGSGDCSERLAKDALDLLKEAEEEIVFLKSTQLQLVKGMDENKIGNIVGTTLGLFRTREG